MTTPPVQVPIVQEGQGPQSTSSKAQSQVLPSSSSSLNSTIDIIYERRSYLDLQEGLTISLRYYQGREKELSSELRKLAESYRLACANSMNIQNEADHLDQERNRIQGLLNRERGDNRRLHFRNHRLACRNTDLESINERLREERSFSNEQLDKLRGREHKLKKAMSRLEGEVVYYRNKAEPIKRKQRKRKTRGTGDWRRRHIDEPEIDPEWEQKVIKQEPIQPTAKELEDGETFPET